MEAEKNRRDRLKREFAEEMGPLWLATFLTMNTAIIVIWRLLGPRVAGFVGKHTVKVWYREAFTRLAEMEGDVQQQESDKTPY